MHNQTKIHNEQQRRANHYNRDTEDKLAERSGCKSAGQVLLFITALSALWILLGAI